MSVALPILTFLAGAWLTLVIRALIADRAQRRLMRATTEALTDYELDELRASIRRIDDFERERLRVGT